MNWCVDKVWVAGLLLLLGAFEVQAFTPSNITLQVEGIRVPEYNPDGSLKSELFGDSVRPVGEGLVEVTNLKLNFYKNGKLDGFVTTPRCIYNKEERQIFSNADVLFQQGDVIISGTGFRWMQDRQVVEIMNRSSVVIKNVQIWKTEVKTRGKKNAP